MPYTDDSTLGIVPTSFYFRKIIPLNDHWRTRIENNMTE
jgi:hypothetical protein